jgi:LPXTG-motif cell wall-anchored protein
VTGVTSTQITCRAPSSLSSGLQSVTVTNTESTLSDTEADAVRYVDAAGWIIAKFPPPSAAGTTLTKDLNKILDSRGNCNRDVDKFFRDLDKLVNQAQITRTEADQGGAFFLSLCTQQTNPTLPVAPVRITGAPVGANPPAPACSASVTSSSFTLNFASAADPVTQFSYERSGFDYAGFWVRVDGGTWTPAVGLVPANGSGSAIDWSNEFVQSLIHFGGVETFTADHSYALEIAFGRAGTLDTYDAANAKCQVSLTVYVATLPETGANTNVPFGLAIGMTMAGAALVLASRRRRTA